MKKLFFALFIFVGLATKAQPKTITLTSNVTQICKGSSVTFTASANFSAMDYTWEVSHDGGASFTSIPNQYQSTYTTSSLLHNDKVRVMTLYEDWFAFPPSMPTEITSNQIQVQVNGTKADINIISTATSGSIQFNGSNQYLTLSNSPNYGSAAFTIDGWFRLDAAPSNYVAPIIGSEATNSLAVLIQSDLTRITVNAYDHHGDHFTVPTITIGVWHHLAVVRNSSGDLTVFLDGQRSSSGAITQSFSFSTADVNVGKFQSNFLSGYLSNLRVVTGTNLYDPTQNTLTVPNSLTTAVTNTNLLLNAVSASSLLTDGSGTQTSITNNGSATWSGGTPFLVNLNSSSNATISNATVGGVWSSSNNSILEVNSSGGLTPIATGNATITYTVTSTTPFTCVSTESSLFSTTVCNNPTNGGTIASAQSGSNGFDPAAFTSSAAPTGHSGTLEYKWQSSTTSSSTGFSDIASSNSATYDAGALTQKTWFKRLARVDCKSDWSGAAESNVLEICITPTAGITNNTGSTALTCNRTSINVTATGGVSYAWSGGLGSSDAATISSAGTYTVTVTGANSCTSTAAISIVSIPSPNATISASGATTFTYGNSVVLSGPPFVLPSVVESVGNALSLNGTSDYVSIPSGINNNFSGNQITVEGWFYPTTQLFNNTALIGEAYEGDGVIKFVLSSEFESGVQKIKAGFFSDAYGWVQGTSSVNLSYNQWTHIAATYDQANIKIYVNGSLTCTYANTNALPNGSESWFLGKKWDEAEYCFFPGTMDEVRIWNVARTQAQIQFSMNNRISTTTSGLVGYYKLDESSGTTATDATGHGYDGTVN